MPKIVTAQHNLDNQDQYTVTVQVADSQTQPNQQKTTNKIPTPLKIAAFDHRGSLKKMIDESRLSDFKALCTTNFAPFSTAILVDPEYGIESIELAKQLNLQILLSREISGYTDNPNGRVTELYKEFTSEKLKSMGANAVKLLLYYNRDASNAPDQKRVLEQVKKEAQEVQLPVLLEPITYPVEGKPYDKGESIIKAVQDLNEFCDVLKLEFPIDVAKPDKKNQDNESHNSADLEPAIPYLKQITDEANQPWVLLSRGMPFETYKQALTLSKQMGAQGYAVGRGVWQEIANFETWQEIEIFMQTTARERMKELSDIFSEDLETKTDSTTT